MSGAYARATAEGPWSTLALHTIGWKAFQDLCAQVCQEVLHSPVETFSEASDAGQDAVLILLDKERNTRIGSVQCKFTSKADKRLRVLELHSEMAKVRELSRMGLAHTYVLMTNESISAPVAADLRRVLKEIGVVKPHILGRQFIVRAIASSPKLRALVPQVYGLGDISRIMDQRCYDQTKAILGQWLTKLSLYVPTVPHRLAVECLTRHNAVLLLGNPSVGKSAIGAILSILAAATGHETVLSVIGPKDFITSWNPHDPKRFFWIDDAFGPNVLRDDYVQDWAMAFQRVQVAMNNGNRFLFTSRRHIYYAAKPKLGQRNLSVFNSEAAVVDVGALTIEEKRQILYNHVAFGNQSDEWKRRAKPFLEQAAQTPEFLPGIAERLGNSTFTKGVIDYSRDLISFMRHPKRYLIETIESLDDVLQASLFIVYVHGGVLRQESIGDEASKMISEVLGESIAEITRSLPQLEGSFVRRLGEDFPASWVFSHPTMSDAITDIVRKRPELISAFIGGAPLATILSSFVCEGAPLLKDAGIIPQRLSEMLIARIGSSIDEYDLNRRSFNFLFQRTTDVFLFAFMKRYPEFLQRSAFYHADTSSNLKFHLFGRLHSLGILPVSQREEAVSALETAALSDFDLKFFSDQNLMALFKPTEALQLGLKTGLISVPNAETEIENLGDEADIDEDPSSHFEAYSSGFALIEEMINYGEPIGAFAIAKSAIEDQIEYLDQAQSEKAREEEEKRRWGDEDSGYYGTSPSQSVRKASIFDDVHTESPPRSIFEDVDVRRS